jgi:hypothetical protein|tara:strand:- start:8339 stop:8536 length:198 start_codon:yes stop_codon:yes gene_type:complete
MALSFKEVCEELTKIDETTLLEILDITSEDIVNKFQDKIEDNLEELSNDLDEHTKQLDFTFNDEE